MLVRAEPTSATYAKHQVAPKGLRTNKNQCDAPQDTDCGQHTATVRVGADVVVPYQGRPLAIEGTGRTNDEVRDVEYQNGCGSGKQNKREEWKKAVG